MSQTSDSAVSPATSLSLTQQAILARNPVPRTFQLQSYEPIQTKHRAGRGTDTNLGISSLDHAMWFHAPFRADEWVMFVMDSPVTTGGHGLARRVLPTRWNLDRFRSSRSADAPNLSIPLFGSIDHDLAIRRISLCCRCCVGDLDCERPPERPDP